MTGKQKNESEHWATYWVTQKLILWRRSDNSFLIVKQNDPGFKKKYPAYDPWGLLGGHLDVNETDLIASLKREVSEEAGDIQFELLAPVFISLLGDVKISYLAEFQDGEITLNAEHTEYMWKTAEEIESETKYHPLLKQAIQEAKKKLQELSYLDDLKRLQADFENYKKRMKRDQAEMAQFMIQGLVTDLVPVLDNFHAAIAHVPEAEKGSAWVTGITYIEKQFEDVLKNYGVEPLEVKPGDTFDPTKHEAVDSKQSTENNEQDSKEGELVIEKVVQKGFKLKGKVIRAAKVIVK